MAITKTAFIGATAADQAPEVLAWLQANAVDYFDSITYDSEHNKIICSKDSVAAISLGLATGVRSIEICAKNGASAYQAKQDVRFAYGITTPTAICLVCDDNQKNTVVVTKSNNGELFMIAKITPATQSNTTHLYITDFNNSPTITNIPYIFSNAYSSFDTSIAHTSVLTSLTPIPALDYPSYAPNVYLEFFNEYNGVTGKIIINGEEYWSNGYLALKG